MDLKLSQDIRRIASDILEVPASRLTSASSPENVETWDSIQHLTLVMALEQHLGMKFDPEEIESMRSIGAIESVVFTKRGS